jgi:hypothetical protein
MAQVQLILTATIELTIELPDSKLKSLIVDGEIDVHKYIDVDIRSDFKSDFKRCEVSDLTIDVEDPTISSWETIETNKSPVNNSSLRSCVFKAGSKLARRLTTIAKTESLMTRF